jgi:hypothetical protein
MNRDWYPKFFTTKKISDDVLKKFLFGTVLGISRFQMWSTHVPTVKGWTFDTTTGPINFHANREQFEAIGNAFLPSG